MTDSNTTEPKQLPQYTREQCGETFGTNCTEDDIACPECEAIMCPHCKTWFGGDQPMSIRIPVTLVIEMDDEQEVGYRDAFGLPKPPRARDIVASVRGFAAAAVEQSLRTAANSTATVTVKER